MKMRGVGVWENLWGTGSLWDRKGHGIGKGRSDSCNW